MFIVSFDTPPEALPLISTDQLGNDLAHWPVLILRELEQLVMRLGIELDNSG
jgi:hypothetical protein